MRWTPSQTSKRTLRLILIPRNVKVALILLAGVIASSRAAPVQPSSTVWSATPTAAIVGIAAADSTVFALLKSGVLEARRANTGQLQWSLPLGNARRWVALETSNSQLLARFESPSAAGMVAIDARARRVEWAWWAPSAGQHDVGATRVIGVAGGLVVWAETVVGAYMATRVYGIAASTGKQAWSVSGTGVFGIAKNALYLSDSPFSGPEVLTVKRVTLSDGRVKTFNLDPPVRSTCQKSAIVGVNGPLGITGERVWAMVQDGCGAFAVSMNSAGSTQTLMRDLPRAAAATDSLPDLLRVDDSTRVYWLESKTPNVTSNAAGRLVALDLATGRKIVYGEDQFIRPRIQRFGSSLMVVSAGKLTVFDEKTGATALAALAFNALEASATKQVLIVHDGVRLVRIRNHSSR